MNHQEEISDTQVRIDVALLKQQMAHLVSMLEQQNRNAELQKKILDELVVLAAQGKGSLWMFITLGGAIATFILNFKNIIEFFSRS